MATPLEDIARELPDGPVWLTGAWVKRLLTALIADRARAGNNVDEIPTDKGRFFNAQAGAAAATVATAPLTIVDASAKDAKGTAHPGRVRVYNGMVGGILPSNMNLPDGILANGTDNQCYLTVPQGTNYAYIKVLLDEDTGLPSSASAYTVTSPEEADGTYVYYQFGIIAFDGTTVTIYDNQTGNRSLLVYWSADGTIAQGVFFT